MNRLWILSLGLGALCPSQSEAQNLLTAPGLALFSAATPGSGGGAATGAFANYTNSVLADHPVGFWPLNETSGTALRDASGSGLDGYFTNMTALGQSGPTNGFLSMKFTASSQSLGVVPDAAALRLTNDLSIEAWVKSSGGYQARGVVAKWMGDTGNYRAYSLSMLANGFLQWNLSADGTSGNGKSLPQSSGPVGTNWTHVVCTFTRTNLVEIYINGSRSSWDTTTMTNVFVSPADLRIGNSYSAASPNYFWDGNICCVALYSNALPANTVSNHYYQALH